MSEPMTATLEPASREQAAARAGQIDDEKEQRQRAHCRAPDEAGASVGAEPDEQDGAGGHGCREAVPVPGRIGESPANRVRELAQEGRVAGQEIGEQAAAEGDRADGDDRGRDAAQDRPDLAVAHADSHDGEGAEEDNTKYLQRRHPVRAGMPPATAKLPIRNGSGSDRSGPRRPARAGAP